ncbi:MAG: peptide chain release factor 2 [bacterium]
MNQDINEELGKIEDSLNKLRGIFELDEKLKQIKELELETSEEDFWNDASHAQEKIKLLNEIKGSISAFQLMRREYVNLKELSELLKSEVDDELQNELIAGIDELRIKISEYDFKIKLSDEHSNSPAIITLHAGAGGTESCDWAEMLLRMYLRWAESKGFKSQIVDILPGEEAGVKRVTFIIRGEYAFGLLQGEIGVHRLVRISPFDSNKRRHTSFAACDVIPDVEEDITIDLKDSDMRVDTYRASGHGGQHVNKTDSAVRITHIPSGIVVQCQNERSQYKNKMTCLKMLKAKLYQLEQEKKKAKVERLYDEKGDIAWGNQVRSYVFMPYQMVKDHRTGYEIGNVDTVMDGNIDGLIKEYHSWKLLKK